MSTMIKPWKRLQTELYEHSRFRKIEDVLFEMPDGRQDQQELDQNEYIEVVLKPIPEFLKQLMQGGLY